MRKPVTTYFPYKHRPHILFINIHNIAQPCNYVKRRYATKMHSNIQRIYIKYVDIV